MRSLLLSASCTTPAAFYACCAGLRCAAQISQSKSKSWGMLPLEGVAVPYDKEIQLQGGRVSGAERMTD